MPSGVQHSSNIIVIAAKVPISLGNLLCRCSFDYNICISDVAKMIVKLCQWLLCIKVMLTGVDCGHELLLSLSRLTDLLITIK